MEWIDIKKTIPDFETPILVCGENKIFIARLVRKSQTIDSVSLEFQVGDSGLEDLWITPTHWMPLPVIVRG